MPPASKLPPARAAFRPGIVAQREAAGGLPRVDAQDDDEDLRHIASDAARMKVRNVRLMRERMQDRKAFYKESIARLKSQQRDILAAEGLSENGEDMKVDEDK